MKIFLLIFLFSNSSMAGGAIQASLSQQTAIGANVQPKQDSIYGSATQVKKQNEAGQKQAQMISSGLNSGGQALISACCGDECTSQCPVGITMVAMGILAGMQAGSHGKTAGQAGMTMAATDALGNRIGADSGNTDNVRGLGTDISGFNKAASILAKDFASKKIPITFDGKKLVGPHGFKIGPEDVMSATGMAAAGLSKDQIASISGELSKLNKAAEDKYKLTTPNFGFSEGGGGGGGAYGKGAPGGDGGADGMNGLGRAGQASLSSINSKAATSGLTKDYHGDPIGVSNDSIFSMMTKRYQLKDHQDSFISSSPAAVQK